jgi:hypothetical protein
MREIRARAFAESASRKLIAVELVETRRAAMSQGWQFFASLKPVAIVVCGPSGTLALDLEAKPVDLDKLREESPSLDAEIERYESQWPDSA